MALREFEEWLSKKLDSFEIDSETYVSYLIEILKDEDEDPSEVSELVKETLGSVTDQDIGEFSKEIMMRWEKVNNNEDDSALKEAILEQETTTHLTDLVSSHLHLAQKQKEEKKEVELSAERKSVKESVLALYNNQMQSSADGYDDEDEEGAEKDSDDEELVRNTNAQAVSSAERVERERRKEEAMKKREKDKLDLETQKLKKIERKEKEKKRTAKKERGGR